MPTFLFRGAESTLHYPCPGHQEKQARRAEEQQKSKGCHRNSLEPPTTPRTAASLPVLARMHRSPLRSPLSCALEYEAVAENCPIPFYSWKGASKSATSGGQPDLQDPSTWVTVSVSAQRVLKSALIPRSVAVRTAGCCMCFQERIILSQGISNCNQLFYSTFHTHIRGR